MFNLIVCNSLLEYQSCHLGTRANDLQEKLKMENHLIMKQKDSTFCAQLHPGMWKQKRKLEAEAVEAVLFLFKRKRENPTASAFT